MDGWGKINDTFAHESPRKVIAFQIQLYELGLDAEWIRKQVAFRGMESRERLRYEFDGTERFFTDGVPSARTLPTGAVTGSALKPPFVPKPPPLAQSAPKSPPKLLLQQQHPHPHPHPQPQPQRQQQQQTSPLQRPPQLVRRESRLRYMETYEASENITAQRADNKDEVLMMLGRMRLGNAEDVSGKAELEPASTKRTNRRRRGKNRAVYP